MKKMISVVIIMAIGFSSLLYAGNDTTEIVSGNSGENKEVSAYNDRETSFQQNSRTGEYAAEFAGGMAGSGIALGMMVFAAYEGCKKSDADGQCGLNALLFLPLMPVFAGAGVYAAGSFYHTDGAFSDTLLTGFGGCTISILLMSGLLSSASNYDDGKKGTLISIGSLGLLMAGCTVGAMYGYHRNTSKRSSTALLNIDNSQVTLAFPAIGYAQIKNNLKQEHVVYVQLVNLIW